VVVCLNEDGSVDSGFGNGGSLVFPNTAQSTPALALQADGKILTGGHQDDPLGGFVARLNDDGSADEFFGDGGMILTDPDNGEIYEVGCQGDGKILLSVNGAGLMRLHPDGELDGTFLHTPPASFQTIERFAFLADGSFLVSSPYGNKIWLARYLPDDPAMLVFPDPVEVGDTLALSATATHGLNGAITGVDFYLDDGDGILDDALDAHLGAAVNHSGVWDTSLTVDWDEGTQLYFAKVTYASGITVVSQQGIVIPAAP
jgi:uncharacterized delta-60 repeat protein